MSQSAKIAILKVRNDAGRTLFLDLVGPLRLHNARGVDVTPRSRKAQGLLALIGTSPYLRRSRAWLQDKLWSDRGQKQGAGSLRQTLTEVRSALGEHVDCLYTEMGWVALDPARVRVRGDAPEVEPEAEAEFLEGLDIRDPEFEHWVRDQRSRYSERVNRSAAEATANPGHPTQSQAVRSHAGLTVGLDTASLGPDTASLVGGFLLDLLARSLLGCGVEVMDFRAKPHPDFASQPLVGPDLLLHATESVRGDCARVALRLSKSGGMQVLWTDAATFEVAAFYEPEHAALDAFADRSVQSVLEHMPGPAVPRLAESGAGRELSLRRA